MALFKCKMCGGALNVQNESVVVCEYCGTQQTLPKTTDDVIANLFNRANNLRLKCEFDKAAQIYEKIVEQNNEEAEAYWGLVLCKYGIEYVEDPKTRQRIPTCHRTLFDAVTTDADYQAAIDFSDAAQQAIYEKEARSIDKIQKDILSIVKNEKPFDVFICYKETDESGKRTVDSAIANDIYHQLTQEGFKVFYAAITLEDKLGQEYEPYIFAALNSAKVMLVLGTKPEFFNAVWVKNEWSRFLHLMKTDRSKLLIPCYRDMDAYDLPEEFAHLQAQDMGKIGFINDVIRGIKKIVKSEEPTATVVKETVVSAGNTNTAPLLKRAFMFLEDGDFDRADEFCEQVLNLEPENAQAYLGKLMAELQVKKQEALKDQAEPFDHNNNYQKTVRFADENLKAELIGYIEHINTRNENTRLESIYTRAKNVMSAASTEGEYKEAAQLFESVSEYLDSASLAQTCYEKAEVARKDAILAKAKDFMIGNFIQPYASAIHLFKSISGWKDADEQIIACRKKIEEIKVKAETERKDEILAMAKKIMTGNDLEPYESAINMFKSISGWRDADEQVLACQRKIEEIKAKKEAERLECERKAEIARKEAVRIAKRNKMIAMIVTPIVCLIIAFIILLNAVIIPNNKYNNAIALMEAGEYFKAISVFESLDEYKDSKKKISECYNAIDQAELNKNYNNAIKLMEEGKYTEAISAFKALGSYKDSAVKIEECKIRICGEDLWNELKSVNVGDTFKFGSYEQDNNSANGKEKIEWIVLSKEGTKIFVISKYALDCKPYNTSYTEAVWETCSLRKWLNSDFINSAFSTDEKILIPIVTVSEYGTNATQDQVFLLSYREANELSDAKRLGSCIPTAYAAANGVKDFGDGHCYCWLRSQGIDPDYAGYFSSGGTGEGEPVDCTYYGVRPAMWIDVNF